MQSSLNDLNTLESACACTCSYWDGREIFSGYPQILVNSFGRTFLPFSLFTLPTRQRMLKMYPVKNKNARNILLQSWIDVSIGATPVFCLSARRVTYDSYRPSQTGHLAQPKMACFKWEGLTTDTEAWQTFPALTTLISYIIVSCIVLRGQGRFNH